MKVEVLTPVNYKNRTVEPGQIIELDDVAAKTLIELKAVKEVKDTKQTTGELK